MLHNFTFRDKEKHLLVTAKLYHREKCNGTHFCVFWDNCVFSGEFKASLWTCVSVLFLETILY